MWFGFAKKKAVRGFRESAEIRSWFFSLISPAWVVSCPGTFGSDIKPLWLFAVCVSNPQALL